MRYLGFIPARGGSKGIPRKNLVPVAGKPLIAHTFDAALRSKRLSRTILSTDDPEIAEAGRRAGVEVPFLRPAELAQDASVMEDAMLHALARLKDSEGYAPDAVVLLQPTAPLRRPEQIDAAIALFEAEGADSLVSVSEPMEHPCDMASFAGGKMRLLFQDEGFDGSQQRQQFPDLYFINGAIYITKAAVLLATKSRFGGSIVPYRMPQLDSVDVDSQDDLKIAELLLAQRPKG